MNYKERIAALTSFKSAVSGDDTSDDVSRLSSDVSGWIGGSYDKFGDFIQIVKDDCSNIAGKKSAFLSEVDGRISQIQGWFDAEVAANKWRVTTTYDPTNTSRDNQMKRSAINQLAIDSSVKAYLLSLI